MVAEQFLGWFSFGAQRDVGTGAGFSHGLFCIHLTKMSPSVSANPSQLRPKSGIMAPSDQSGSGEAGFFEKFPSAHFAYGCSRARSFHGERERCYHGPPRGGADCGLLRNYFAPAAADSVYQEVIRCSQFKRACQTTFEYLARFGLLRRKAKSEMHTVWAFPNHRS